MQPTPSLCWVQWESVNTCVVSIFKKFLTLHIPVSLKYFTEIYEYVGFLSSLHNSARPTLTKNMGADYENWLQSSSGHKRTPLRSFKTRLILWFTMTEHSERPKRYNPTQIHLPGWPFPMSHAWVHCQAENQQVLPTNAPAYPSSTSNRTWSLMM